MPQFHLILVPAAAAAAAMAQSSTLSTACQRDGWDLWQYKLASLAIEDDIATIEPCAIVVCFSRL